MIGLLLVLVLLVILLVAVTVAAWEVGGLLLLSAVILGLAFGLRRPRREQSEPGPPEREPQRWQPKPRTRDPHGH